MLFTSPTAPDHVSDTLTLPFYFFSDNHLSSCSGPAQQERLRDMLACLAMIRDGGGTLFILGDFFDFWFDHRDYVPPALRPIVAALRTLSERGVAVHYIGGNHDYWITGYLTRETGIRFHPGPIEFECAGTRFFCLHGDEVVYRRAIYPLIRRILRAPVPIALLKCLPPSVIYALGERISKYNQRVDQIPAAPEAMIAKLHAFLREKLREGYDIAISGHVHNPDLEKGETGTTVILGDWIRNRRFGRWDENGFRLVDMNAPS
ncbi:MAG: UDP-2,3-diacylglucosamine diphosphatase [Candidatus Marinimicrobia bacterium]|nr:UDP-2,3-diacylglucosamine diphosphatase [Candidatus Neomarinimicrobiota bacterium]